MPVLKPTIRWERLGWLLRTAMEERRDSFRDLERMTGVDHATLHRLATGKVVTAEAMLAVCAILELDPMTLFMPHEVDERVPQ